MTTDEKSHTQTQITRDIETFLHAARKRAEKAGVTATLDEIKAIAQAALAGPDRSDQTDVGSKPQQQAPK